MKAYKVELLVLDFEDVSEEDMKYQLENIKYLNTDVMDIKSADIGEWSDDHPLNHNKTQFAEFKRLFKEQ